MIDRAARAAATRTRTVVTRRRIGRVVTVAAVTAAVTCVVGAVVAWQLLGDVRDRSATTLQLLERTLANVDDSLVVAQDVTTTVGSSVQTLRDSLDTVSDGAGDSATALESIADVTETIPPALDRLDATLADLRDGARAVDSALAAIDQLPIGPDIDTDAGLATSVDGVRDDVRPIAEDLRTATVSIRNLAAASDDLPAQLAALDADLVSIDASLARSRQLLANYRADAADATTLASTSLDELDRDIAISRVLATILALAIAVGQIAPFHIGRQLAASPTPESGGADVVRRPMSSQNADEIDHAVQHRAAGRLPGLDP